MDSLKGSFLPRKGMYCLQGDKQLESWTVCRQGSGSVWIIFVAFLGDAAERFKSQYV